MNCFFRFPHTPHLAWLGDGSPRDDKVLKAAEVDQLLSRDVVVEEKLDGANLGLSVGADGQLQVQNRGQYLTPPFHGQFSRLASWLPLHGENITEALGHNLILFGEWCAARHSLGYDMLPDWFVAFDVYDRTSQRFWSTARRNRLVAQLGLAVVPAVFRGPITLPELKQRLITGTTSHGTGPAEGLIIRREDADWLEERAKLVRPDFTQAITDHWTSRKMEWNKVIATGASSSMTSCDTPPA